MAQSAAAASGMMFDDDPVEREPFGAYVADEASQAAAQAVAQQRSWSTSSIRKGGLNTALRLLGVAPPPRFMIVDIEGLPIEEAEAGLTELARLGSAVLALGTVNDVNYFRRIMRSGTRDYLIKPVDAEMLTDVFVRLETPSDGVQHKGRVVGVLGARGGVGATTLATNIAWIMAERLSRRTALIDMDLYAGNVALSLDMEPTRGLREAFDDPERVDEVFLQNAMAKFGRGLHVLATEESFEDAVRMSDEKVLMIADTMRSNFDMSVMDLPRHFVMREPALFSRFDDIVIVVELTLHALRDASRLTRLMQTRNRDAKIHIVANRTPPKPDVSAKEFEAAIEGRVKLQIPMDSKVMTRANLKGQVLAAADPKHKTIADLHRLCIELAGVPEETKQTFFQRHFGSKKK
jgi:pilus assembly protein CpaE